MATSFHSCAQCPVVRHLGPDDSRPNRIRRHAMSSELHGNALRRYHHLDLRYGIEGMPSIAQPIAAIEVTFTIRP
jgi:hypothetical protein